MNHIIINVEYIIMQSLSVVISVSYIKFNLKLTFCRYFNYFYFTDTYADPRD